MKMWQFVHAVLAGVACCAAAVRCLGRFGKDGKSNIKALYIDKIELSLAGG